MTPNRTGRHFLQVPGPTNVPDRVLRAMAQPTIDHRSDEFAALTREVMSGLQGVFKNSGPVIVYPSSATGAWEAAFVNTLSPGDKVLSIEIGEFARLWAELAKRLGLQVDVVETDWTRGVDPAAVEAKLAEDRDHRIKAILVVHNETSTGATSRLGEIRRAIDRAKHPAMYFVDAVSSLASIDLRQDEWGIDVVVAGSQKGLMLPPGMAFNSISQKALAASRTATLTKSYWSWGPMIAANADGFFAYTPSTNLMFGLREALRMLREEGLDNVFARHVRLAEATRAAVNAWGLEILCKYEPERSPVVTSVVMPGGFNSDEFRRVVVDRLNLSLGAGLGRLKGRVFRIGHLGDFNELMLMGTLCGVEMGLSLAGVPFNKGGVAAAMNSLVASPVSSPVGSAFRRIEPAEAGSHV
jgi:alanine-glyoxylate transaminase / serine-glyoxylate transaminase / serine-pyruvate transaminase